MTNAFSPEAFRATLDNVKEYALAKSAAKAKEEAEMRVIIRNVSIFAGVCAAAVVALTIADKKN